VGTPDCLPALSPERCPWPTPWGLIRRSSGGGATSRRVRPVPSACQEDLQIDSLPVCLHGSSRQAATNQRGPCSGWRKGTISPLWVQGSGPPSEQKRCLRFLAYPGSNPQGDSMARGRWRFLRGSAGAIGGLWKAQTSSPTPRCSRRSEPADVGPPASALNFGPIYWPVTGGGNLGLKGLYLERKAFPSLPVAVAWQI
jgi:hypothetical protein